MGFVGRSFGVVLRLPITISIDGVSYNLACGSESSWHYEIEISIDKDELKVL